MTDQVIKTEKDLDEAIRSLDEKHEALEEKRKQRMCRWFQIDIGLTIMAMAFWIFIFYHSMTTSSYHDYLRVVAPLFYAFILISLVGSFIRKMHRYRRRQLDNRRTEADIKLSLLNIMLVGIYCDVFLIANMITYREQLFFWPQVTSSGLNIPSIVIYALLLFGVNWLVVRAVRQRLHELHVYGDKGYKTV